MNVQRPITGRLAPSPTGELHLGNLSSSLLAWAQARSCGGRLVLRIEDIDGPRVVAGAAARQVEDLRALGIEWDEGPDVGGPHAPYVQSERGAIYREALGRLGAAGLTYPCWCSRRDLEAAASAPHGRDGGAAYPGTCARLSETERGARGVAAHAVRFRAVGVVELDDAICGLQRADLATDPGDFVVVRRDGLVAYQLAVVVDDIAMGVTDVVRGRDLLESAPRQVALWEALGAVRPRFWHVPMLLTSRGERLAKRDRSVGMAGLLDEGWTPSLLRGGLMVLWGWRDRLDEATTGEVAESFGRAGLRRDEIFVPDAFFEGPRAFAAKVGTQRED